MPKERIKQPTLCETCISRLICPVAGRACLGHNNPSVFKSLLKQYAPHTDWDAVLVEVEKIKKSSRGYRK